MKKSIKLSALVVLFSAGIFASANAKDNGTKLKMADQVSISAAHNPSSLNVNILKAAPGKSTVAFYDAKHNLIMKDYVAGKLEAGQAYNLKELENGNYTVEVSSANNTVTKAIHVYEDGQQKTFFFFAE